MKISAIEMARLGKENLSLSNIKIASNTLAQEARLIYIWLLLDLKNYACLTGNTPSYTEISGKCFCY